MKRNQTHCFDEVRYFTVGLFVWELRAKRFLSLTDANLDVIKQMHRLLCNEEVDVDTALGHLVRDVVGSHAIINVTVDWNDFDADGPATTMPSILTRHGEAPPVLWHRVEATTLRKRLNDSEYQVFTSVAESALRDIKVSIISDGRFGSQKSYRKLTEELKVDCGIGLRSNITLTSATDETRNFVAFVGAGGRTGISRGAFVTIAAIR
jgi:hypothetical protein